MTLNGPIRGEREAILGYYYVAMEDSRFSVDHLTIQKMLNAVGCLVPVVLRLRRILTGTVEGEIEAGVRFDFYLAHRGLELISIPYRIIDSAFIYPRSLDEQTVAHKEASEQRRRVSTIKNNIDLKYDTALCGLLQAAGDRTENLLWNLQNRLAMEKAHLRELIRRRVEEVGRLWISRPSSDSFENESTEGGGIEHKVSLLIQQMITKELPYALTDSTKKLPISTLSHERPTIAMKTARGASGGNNGSNTINIPKKRTKVTNGTKGIMAKIPPRPILPATMPPNGMRSRSPSSDGESPIKVDPSDG